jgi:hypothetical protein
LANYRRGEDTNEVVMEDRKIEKLLGELRERLKHHIRSGLEDDIKGMIPSRLVAHTINTINVIIDLRINRLAAAAAIIITMILMASLLGGADVAGNNIYSDGELLMRYIFGLSGASQSDMLAVRSKYEYLVQEGIEAVYYGDKADLNDGESILLQWKLPDGRYEVILGDLHKKTVTAEELIELQSQMLQERIKR